ncbi:MAG TPA: ABC transporter ATP-binding protein [Acidimicrobiia bacterium]|nr:ABC transporter ATP-binding protein [Acidimicrobiia bacterium]
MTEPAIHPGRLVVEGVSKTFGGQPILSGVDLTVEAGSTVVLLGPSGCGKTTLLRIVAGLETADSGSVSLGERRLAGSSLHLPAERRRIGMVFQDWALFPHLDVAANVGYGLDREERNSGRVEETLELVGLDRFGSRMPHTLSGGQQQRVAIARAIAPRPEALLLDEPFSNLDAALRAQVRSDTHALLHEIGVTALFVTHDQEEAFVLADEVAIMRDGRIRQQGDPDVVYSHPVDPWVAAFVGDANVFDVDAAGGVASSPVGTLSLADRVDGFCRVLVRPEELEIGPGDEGEVVAVEYYGHDTTYRVALPETEVVVRAMSRPRVRVGDRVQVAYRGPEVVVFPAADTPTPVGA